MPFWLVGAILKNSLMASALPLAAGLLATRTPGDRRRGAGAVVVAVVALAARA